MKQGTRRRHWRHLSVICPVIAALSAALVFLFLRVNFIPNPGSVERVAIDDFVKLLFAIGGVFFAIVVTVFAYALIFFRRKPCDDSDAEAIRGNTPLEITWTLIPLAVVTALGVYGAIVLDGLMPHAPAMEMPQSELVVNVVSFRFGWMFEYPSAGARAYELRLPVDRPVLFRLESMDVVHSFWVQEWGPKQDAVPGIITELRITPTKPGTFRVECSQLCGVGHTAMVAPVRVVSSADFENWLPQQQKIPPRMSPGATGTPAPAVTTAPASGGAVTIRVAANNMAFNLKTISVAAGAKTTLLFENQERVPHNVAFYTDQSATQSIYVGETITGPKSITYSFTAPDKLGRYFFRCDLHPATMTGELMVQ